MAQKEYEKFENTRPKSRHSKEHKVCFEKSDVILTSGDSYNGSVLGSDDDTEFIDRSICVEGLNKHSQFEVGSGTGSSFSGSDSYGNDVKAITYSHRMPNMSRYDLAIGFNDIDEGSGNTEFSELISERRYVYSQDFEGADLKKQIPKFELESKPNDTYEEQYFQHVFNWPTSHTIKSRKISGVVDYKETCLSEGEVTSTTTVTQETTEHTFNYTNTLNLHSTTSKIYWIVPGSGEDGTSNWSYQEIVTDDIGRVQGGNGDIQPTFDTNGQLTVSGTGSSEVTLTLEWDDEPGYAGKAIDSIEFAGEKWIRDGAGETGKVTKKVILESGQTYDVTLNGNSGGYVIQNNQVILRDEDGDDINAKFKIDFISNAATEKLGSPIVYHGGTDDDCIFFNYVESKGGNDSNISSTFVHRFNDNTNTTNQLTSSNSNFTIEARSEDDDNSSGNNKKGRKHYVITFTGKKVTSVKDVRITVNADTTASGKTEKLVPSKIKIKNENQIRVWFQTDSGGNSFVRNWTVEIGGLTSGTTDVIAIGDMVNGATVTNVVNYVVKTGLRRTINANSPKGTTQKRISEAGFIDLGYTSSQYNSIESWVRMDDVSDVEDGALIAGEGIEDGTVIVGVDDVNNILYLNRVVQSSKPKVVTIINDEVNRVSKHTLCYATISGGSSFSADTTYNVSRNGTNSGIKVIVRAGKGIINRSAVVGTYFSYGKKNIQYQPIFFSADQDCEKYVEEDSDGNEFTLGTVVWDDGTKSAGKFLLTRPSTTNDSAYKIASIYLSFTLAPIDRETFEVFLKEYEENNIIHVYGLMNAYAKSTLNGKKAALVEDDICRDNLDLEYFQAYDPFLEADDINVKLESVNDSITDDCVVTNEIINENANENGSTDYETIDDVKDRFLEVIQNSVKTSSILSQDYYDKLIADKDSLFNRISDGSDILKNTVPKKSKVSNLPPQIEAEDSSGKIFTKPNYRDIPPALDRVKFFTTDLQFSDKRAIDPTINLDPTTTYNQPVMVVRSKPNWNATSTAPHVETITGTEYSSSIVVTVNNDSNGFVDTITTSPGAITITSTLDVDCTRTATWSSPVDGTDKEFYDRAAWSDNYTIATNWFLPPDLRDLYYEERENDNDLSLPTAKIYPEVIWQPNVSYQMDFYKMFHFRMKELSEMIGETVLNRGNPFIDETLSARLIQDLGRRDTTIKVDSTAGFFSSGYLIIPKYTKKVATGETGNHSIEYTYVGEEIIYYGSKTDTSFENCRRALFNTTPGFESTIDVNELEKGVRYRIESLGNTNWKKIGAPTKKPEVGTVFVATGDGKGSGTVSLFGGNNEEIPDEELVGGVVPDPKVAVISSYERGFSLAQFNVFSLLE